MSNRFKALVLFAAAGLVLASPRMPLGEYFTNAG